MAENIVYLGRLENFEKKKGEDGRIFEGEKRGTNFLFLDATWKTKYLQNK